MKKTILLYLATFIPEADVQDLKKVIMFAYYYFSFSLPVIR